MKSYSIVVVDSPMLGNPNNTGPVLPLRIGGVYFWRLAPPEIGGATAPPSKFYLQNIPPENHRTFWVQDFHACRNKMDMYACKCVENRN